MDGRASLWNVSPRPADHRSFAWNGGAFDAARRNYTDVVEGTIRSPRHIIMATLRGGARRHEFVTDCGLRYDGPDRPGTVSFLPAGCERRLRLTGVAWEWASIALSPALFAGAVDDNAGATSLASFSNLDDPFLFGLLRELERLHRIDGNLDATYCEAMSSAVAHYLRRSHPAVGAKPEAASARLTSRQLRRIADHVEAHLEEAIRIADLALLVNISEGHLHRAFRATTGETPLDFIHRRRVHKAIAILASEPASIAELALRVGFSSPSHFSRVFRGLTGINPSQYRRSLLS